MAHPSMPAPVGAVGKIASQSPQPVKTSKWKPNKTSKRKVEYGILITMFGAEFVERVGLHKAYLHAIEYHPYEFIWRVGSTLFRCYLSHCGLGRFGREMQVEFKNGVIAGGHDEARRVLTEVVGHIFTRKQGQFLASWNPNRGSYIAWVNQGVLVFELARVRMLRGRIGNLTSLDEPIDGDFACEESRTYGDVVADMPNYEMPEPEQIEQLAKRLLRREKLSRQFSPARRKRVMELIEVARNRYDVSDSNLPIEWAQEEFRYIDPCIAEGVRLCERRLKDLTGDRQISERRVSTYRGRYHNSPRRTLRPNLELALA